MNEMTRSLRPWFVHKPWFIPHRNTTNYIFITGAFPPRRQGTQCLLKKTGWENNQYYKNKTTQMLQNFTLKSVKVTRFSKETLSNSDTRRWGMCTSVVTNFRWCQKSAYRFPVYFLSSSAIVNKQDWVLLLYGKRDIMCVTHLSFKELRLDLRSTAVRHFTLLQVGIKANSHCTDKRQRRSWPLDLEFYEKKTVMFTLPQTPTNDSSLTGKIPQLHSLRVTMLTILAGKFIILII